MVVADAASAVSLWRRGATAHAWRRACRALLSAVVHRVAAAMSLVGLNSADFLVDGERFWLLEINPRPGATLDIFETADKSLVRAACCGMYGRAVSATRVTLTGATAAEIVYARR